MNIVTVDDSAADREPDELRVENARLARALAEKEVLIAELHHRVKNNLQVVASLLRMHGKSADDETVAELFQGCERRLNAMAVIHEQMCESANSREMQLEQHANTLTANLFTVFGVDPSRISGKVAVSARPEGGPLVLNVDQAVPVGLILNELISNSLKHAFPDGRSGSIRVEARIEARAKDRVVELAVIDDGVGLPETQATQKSKSLGLQIVGILSRQLKGTWELKREAGTVFRLSFPER